MRSARVIYHREAESWWAESPEVPGWTGVAESLEELREQAIEGVPFFAGEGLQLQHLWLDPSALPITGGFEGRWDIKEAFRPEAAYGASESPADRTGTQAPT